MAVQSDGVTRWNPHTGRWEDVDGKYVLMADGRRNYISPVAMGEQAPKDTTSIFRQRPRWNAQKGRFETPIDWGNILNIGVGAGLGLGGLHAAGAFGGGAAGAAAGSGGAGAGTGAGVGAGAGAGVGGAARAMNPILQAALAGLSGLPALLANRGPSAEERALYEQAKQLQQLQMQRIQYQNPLYQAVTQLAMSRLPTASQRELPPMPGGR